jgi:ubiquinone/menaquinone biosynthesis C-methylase UbiE
MGSTSDADAWARRAVAIADVARASAAGGPPPPTHPYFALDHRSTTPLALVDDIATRGIFRKYEHVLDFGGGLGATTRYMTRRLGCTATATARSRAEVTAARGLTARAGLDWQVFHVAADPARLPFGGAAFTHVWILEALPGLGESAAALREAFRVLRPGGHLGLQELIAPGNDDVVRRRLAATRPHDDELASAGFVEIVRRDAGPDARWQSAQADAAWDRVVRMLGENDAWVSDRQTLASAHARGALAVVQLTARRP